MDGKEREKRMEQPNDRKTITNRPCNHESSLDECEYKNISAPGWTVPANPNQVLFS